MRTYRALSSDLYDRFRTTRLDAGPVVGMSVALPDVAATPDTRRQWFAGLDGVRFIAAFLIILHHAGFASGATFRWEFGGLLLGRMDIGVSIFFVLSGFLLYRPFVVAQFDDSAPPMSGPFWIRRLVRIFPAYWVALLFLLAIGTVTVNGLRGFVLSFTLTHVYSPSTAVTGITQSWSLATELGFYLMLPAIAAGARRFSKGRSDSPPRSMNRQALWLLVACGALALFSVVFRIVMAEFSPYEDNSWGALSRLWTPSYLDIFGAGMALAVISAWADRRSLIRTATEAATRRVWLWWVIAALTFWFLSSQLDLERGLQLADVGRELIRQTLYGVVGIAMIAPVIFVRRGTSGFVAFLAWRPLAWLGVVSYGIYLWHQAAIEWTMEILDWPDLTGNFLVLVISATLVSTAIAALSHRFVEEPSSQYVRGRLSSRGRGK